ncbi:DnaD domain protein [Rossellomorea vietnamensis]|uniref:DnaD domain protein n=1 Tax=Rossellomorea vietnamensis TaxID=218284 RepID=A0A5D4MCC0_9BACI|nr:DnaD domain protein [Rossellomorea vietnamensis]TYR99097.1 DnaD domain protein [Rossellomorea vietnamensis]
MKGWIKLHRKILDNELWHDVTTFRLFTLLLLQAAHQEGVKIKGIELKRGQYLRSYSKLAEDLESKEGRGYKKASKSTILRSVKKLIDEGMVTVSETKHGTLFTVTKYQEYQGFDDYTETKHGTDNEPLTERTQNEDRTNPEQEQELKNLRIKECEEEVVVPAAEEVNPFKFFEQEGFGVLGGYIPQKINDWCDDLSEALVLEAMKISVENGKKFWGYVESILKQWSNKGIQTVEQAQAEQQKFREEQSKRQARPPERRGKIIRSEKLPGWYEEHENKAPPPHPTEPYDFDAKKAELEAKLRKYK